MYLSRKYGIELKSMDNMSVMSLVSLEDAIIITVALFSSIKVSDNVFIELLVGLVITVILIFLLNELLGRFIKKRG